MPIRNLKYIMKTKEGAAKKNNIQKNSANAIESENVIKEKDINLTFRPQEHQLLLL